MITVSDKPAWINTAPEEQLKDLINQGETAVLLYGPPRTGKLVLLIKFSVGTRRIAARSNYMKAGDMKTLLLGSTLKKMVLALHGRKARSSRH